MKKVLFRLFLGFLIFSFAAGITGCAALKKKFTRKKKERKTPVYYQVRKYDIKPSMELYEKHYIFWVNWHKNLVAELGNNYKSLGDNENIVKTYETIATRISPRDLNVISNIVTAQLNMAKYAEAYQWSKKALSINENVIPRELNGTYVREILEKQGVNIRPEKNSIPEECMF